MIVSASMNADIPAYHGAWFAHRLEAGYCRIARAEGLGYPRVELTRDEVHGFVFWTRNVAPFMPVLDRMRREGRAFTVQFAITGYAAGIDPAPVSADEAAEQVLDLAGRHGSRVVVWRYDPLLVAPESPPQWHVANFERIARRIEGAADEVIISFARAGRGGITNAAATHDRDLAMKRALVRTLAQSARSHGMRLTLCAQPDLLVPGAAPARCIDASRLAACAGKPVAIATAGFFAGCLCARAIDIGDRDAAAAARFCGARRRPEPGVAGAHSEFLFPTALPFARDGRDAPPPF
jgi:hypothetical protein